MFERTPLPQFQSDIIVKPITAACAARLGRDLARLETIDRPAAVLAMSNTARAHGMGDISAAKSALAVIDARISALRAEMTRCRIVDVLPEDETLVQFGSLVRVQINDKERILDFSGEGPDGVGWTSPIARTLAGQEVGYVADVLTPRRPIRIEILDILKRVGIAHPS